MSNDFGHSVYYDRVRKIHFLWVPWNSIDNPAVQIGVVQTAESMGSPLCAYTHSENGGPYRWQWFLQALLMLTRASGTRSPRVVKILKYIFSDQLVVRAQILHEESQWWRPQYLLCGTHTQSWQQYLSKCGIGMAVGTMVFLFVGSSACLGAGLWLALVKISLISPWPCIPGSDMIAGAGAFLPYIQLL